MSLVSEREKRVFIEMIDCWKEFGCLWDVQDTSYCNRDKRNEAYGSLLEIYKKLHQNATVDDLKKRLENMRSAYKREARKIKASEITGSGYAQIYVPKLWYFNLLKFLDEKTSVIGGIETLEEENENDSSEFISVEVDEVESSSSSSFQTAPVRKRQRTSREKKKDSLIDAAHSLINSKEDKWETIGRALGLQLRDLKPNQQAIAQKLFAEIFFHGANDRLTESSMIYLGPPQYHTYSANAFASPTYNMYPNSTYGFEYNNK